MDKNTVINSVTTNSVHKEQIFSKLKKWGENREFLKFINCNEAKITNKLKVSDIESLRDNLAELFVAYILRTANPSSKLDYEKYNGNPKYSRSPDFTIEFNDSTLLNIEVKRIRYTKKNQEIDQFINHIYKCVKQFQYNLAVSYSFSQYPVHKKLIREIKDDKDQIIENLKAKIINANKLLNDAETYECELLEGFKIKIKKQNNPKPIKWVGGNIPIIYNRKEYYKFADVIFDKIEQLIPEKQNILFIIAENDTHDQDDFIFAMQELESRIRNLDCKYLSEKTTNVCEFLKLYKYLNGIIFYSRWRDKNEKYKSCWINPLVVKKLTKSAEELISCVVNLKLFNA